MRTAVPATSLGFALRFAVLYLAMQLAYAAIPEAWLAAWVFQNGLAVPAALLLYLLGQSDVVALAGALHTPGHAMSIIRGCDGSNAVFLLVAALLAFPGRWRDRLLAIAIGFSALYAFNVARIAALFALQRHDLSLFHVGHGLVAPTLAVLLACGLFVVASRRMRRAAVALAHAGRS